MVVALIDFQLKTDRLNYFLLRRCNFRELFCCKDFQPSYRTRLVRFGVKLQQQDFVGLQVERLMFYQWMTRTVKLDVFRWQQEEHNLCKNLLGHTLVLLTQANRSFNLVQYRSLEHEVRSHNNQPTKDASSLTFYRPVCIYFSFFPFIFKQLYNSRASLPLAYSPCARFCC